MEISLEGDERTLSVVEDLCSDEGIENDSSLSPALLADDRDAAATAADKAKVWKVTKKKSLPNWQKLWLWQSSLLFMLTCVEFLPFTSSRAFCFQKRGN